MPRQAALAWGVLLGALALYVHFHTGVLAHPTPGEFRWPRPDFVAPRAGAAPWLVLLAAAVAGWALAGPLAGPAPRPLAALVCGYLSLVVPAQVVGALAWASGRPLFTPAAWAAAGVAFAAVAIVLSRPRVDAAAIRARRLPPMVLAPAGILVLGLHAHAVARTIRHGQRVWDGGSYHLPVPLQWLATGSLTEPLVRLAAISRGDIDRFANPGNGHLLMSLPLAVGWDMLACLAQLPFLALFGWSAAALARRASGSRAAGAVAGLAALSAPIVADQAAVAMLDLATGALSLFALALAFDALVDAEMSTRRLALAGLAAGLALGTKTTALSHLALLAVALGAALLKRRREARSLRRPAAAFVALLLLPAVFWNVRSWIVFGNPVHPIRIGIGSWALADGMTAEDMSGDWDLDRMRMASRRDWLLFPFKDPEFGDETGFGALWVAVAIVGLARAALEPSSLARDRRLTGLGWLAVLAACGLGIFWFAAARTPRFNLPLLGLLAALGAASLARVLEAPGGRRAFGLFAASAAAVTLVLSLHLHGWDIGPTESRIEQLERDYPGVPRGLDALGPRVIFNDTQDDYTSCPSNYFLFGLDHRHLVYDHPRLAVEDPSVFVERLRRLGATAVFLRGRRDAPRPARYASTSLTPLLSWEGEGFRSVVFDVR